MDRRTALGAIGLGTLGALGALAAGAAVGDPFRTAPTAPTPPPIPKAVGFPREFPHPVPAAYQLPKIFGVPNLARRPLPSGPLFGLPGDGNLLALTVDDGGSSDVLAAYIKFCADTGMRLTFFLNGIRSSWTDNAAALRPLVQSGQVQLGNHTWQHPDLLTVPDNVIKDELNRNEDFIQSTYGVSAKPYFRPPYGNHDARTDAAAASVGYTTPVIWYGSLSDSTEISDADFSAAAQTWLLAQHIVIGHANYSTVTRHFDEIVGLIRERGLVPVTLNDVFAT